jgi:hypothetical protein
MESKLTTYKNGDKEWKLPNGNYHRENSPAIENKDGYRAWYIKGERHREDGPSLEYSNGDKHWYINGIKYTEQEYKNEMRSIKLIKLLK